MYNRGVMQFAKQWYWLIVFLMLTACTEPPARADQSASIAPIATATPPSQRTAIPTWTLPPTRITPSVPTAAPTLVPSSTPSPTAVPCAETEGEVVTATIPSDTLNYAINSRIYLPPCYGKVADIRYPVLYLIHGLNFKEDQWVRLGIATAADDLIAADEIAPIIIVLPRDRKDDRLEAAFIADLLPYIDSTYLTLADRQHRAIGGLSRGGGWSVHIGLQHPELFARVGAHSPAVFFGDENDIVQWTWHTPKDQKPTVYIDIGENDANPQSAAWLDQVLIYADIDHTYLVQAGGHSEKYWTAHVADYLRFYAADWRGTLIPTATPDPEQETIR